MRVFLSKNGFVLVGEGASKGKEVDKEFIVDGGSRFESLHVLGVLKVVLVLLDIVDDHCLFKIHQELPCYFGKGAFRKDG